KHKEVRRSFAAILNETRRFQMPDSNAVPGKPLRTPKYENDKLESPSEIKQLTVDKTYSSSSSHEIIQIHTGSDETNSPQKKDTEISPLYATASVRMRNDSNDPPAQEKSSSTVLNMKARATF